MTQYAGLCIGGPMDGQAAAMTTPHMTVEEKPMRGTLSLSRPGFIEHPLGACTISLKSVRYVWHQLPGMGIWVPEGVTVEQAVSDMATLYANTVNR
jgi:hypothetical protein